MTTAYNLTDTVIRARKRPSRTSTYASITRPVFGGSPVKDLPIPVGINAYNQHMGGVDIGNQYRAGFTTLQHQNQCYWKPLFYYLLDIALVNSYLLYKAYRGLVIGDPKRYRHDHRRFQEGLAKALMTYCEALEHNQIYRPKRAYCAYCQKNRLIWEPKHEQRAFRTNITNIRDGLGHGKREFGTNITNIGGGLGRGSGDGSGGRLRGSKTNWGCDECNIALCKIGDCWRLWHRNLN